MASLWDLHVYKPEQGTGWIKWGVCNHRTSQVSRKKVFILALRPHPISSRVLHYLPLHPISLKNSLRYASFGSRGRENIRSPTAGNSIATIATHLSRSREVLSIFLNHLGEYGKNNNRNNRRKMTIRYERRLLRAASNSTLSSRLLLDRLQLPISSSRTLRYLTNAVNLLFKKSKYAPPLSICHKQQRINYARHHAQKYIRYWGNVLFTD